MKNLEKIEEVISQTISLLSERGFTKTEYVGFVYGRVVADGVFDFDTLDTLRMVVFRLS